MFEMKDGAVVAQEEFVFEQLNTEVIVNSETHPEDSSGVEDLFVVSVTVMIISLVVLYLINLWVQIISTKVGRLCDIANELLGEVRKNDDSK